MRSNCYKVLLGLLLPLLVFCCKNDTSRVTDSETENPKADAGTGQMIDSIAKIVSGVNFRHHPYESSERLKLLEEEVNELSAQNRMSAKLYIEYGQTLLNAGHSQKAIDVFEEILTRLPENKVITQQTKALHEALAISYMRLGEQVNCRDNHSIESCLFPIKGSGLHQDRNGSERAIAIYRQILDVFPDDLQSKWILNLAYMTLGEYPDSVPRKYLIPANVFAPEHSIEVFQNVSMYMGLDVNDLAGGVITDDFDNDGFIDILASSWGLFGEIQFFRNRGDGTFEDCTKAAGLSGLTGGLNLIQADFNNDGDLDFYVCRGAWSGYSWMGQLPNSLLKNNGDGTFSDVTISAGLYNPAPTQSAVWADFNFDGHIDLFVGNETHTENETNPCQLFINQGDGSFVDMAPQLGMNINAYVKGTAAGDINNDGKPDLYLSILNGPNKLYLNKTTETLKFEEIAAQAGVTEPLESFPTWFFDFDNDGFEDLFVSCFDTFSLYQQANEVAADYLNKPFSADLPRLYRNKGDGTFENVTTKMNLDRVLPTMGCNYGDIDNDGFLDFYLGTGAPDYRAIVPNRMFRNNNGEEFQDVTYSGNFGHIQKGHGVGFADFDNDGDQDIYAVMGGSVSGDIFQNALFENPGTGENKSITLILRGVNSNRSAIGAKVLLSLITPDDSRKFMYQTVSSGGSFGSNSLRMEIGIGDAEMVELIQINWPDGDNRYLDYHMHVMPGESIIIADNDTFSDVIELKRIVLKKEHTTHAHGQN